MNKYRNRKVMTPDGEFDSLKEFSRWNELRLLQMAGAITNLRRQVKYELIPAQRDVNGKLIEKAVAYIADFVYEEDGRTVVEDTKGLKTDKYIIKRKLMLWRHGIKIREV